MKPIAHAFITTFGLGHLRPASGTWGSLPPAVIGAGLVLGGLGHSWVWWVVLGLVAVVFGAACVAAGTEAEAKWFKKDPGQVVADETCGMALTLLPLALTAARPVWQEVALVGAGFVLFRAFDVLKPPPAYGLQRLGGGWGILMDDVAAGMYAAGVLLVLGPLVLPLR